MYKLYFILFLEKKTYQKKKIIILNKKTKSQVNKVRKYIKAHNSNFYKKAYLCKIKKNLKNMISVIKIKKKKKKNKMLKVLIFQNL